jgi:glycosyltransferase involved in cell wall biosynthesis
MKDNPAYGDSALRLSVVVPVYNEARTVGSVLESLLALETACPEKEILVVDDGSTDETRTEVKRVAKQHDCVRLLSHSANRGKGTAVRTALAQARGGIVVTMDADGELDPGDLPAVVAPLVEGRADAVNGSRFAAGARPSMPWLSYAANRLITLTANILYGARLTDVQSGLKAFRREALLGLRLRATRFEWEVEVTAKLLRTGGRIEETPIRYRALTTGHAKTIGWRDGVQALWVLAKCRVLPRRCLRQEPRQAP